VETSTLDIYFENNSYDLSEKSKNDLAFLSKKIIQENNSTFSLDIIGFTDSIGSKQSNQQLSLKRAKRVYSEIMIHANSDEGIQQTIISGWFPSVCYSHMFDTSEHIVQIKYRGDGVYRHKSNYKPNGNLSTHRKVVVEITENIPNWEWGVLYQQSIPNTDSMVYFVNGIRLLLNAGSIRAGDFAMRNLSYDLDTLPLLISYTKVELEELFQEIIDYKDSLFIVLGKAHIDSFTVQNYRLRCKSLTNLIEPIQLRIPVPDDVDVKLNLFTTKPLKFATVLDSSRSYLKTDISKGTIAEKESEILPGGADAWKSFLYEYYYDVQIDVMRDSIFLTKAIHKKDNNLVTIRFRGRDIPPMYLKYKYFSEPIAIEFKQIKNYLLFFRQYEAIEQLYDQESAIKIWITNPKNNKRMKKKRLKSFKTEKNAYLIKRRKVF